MLRAELGWKVEPRRNFGRNEDPLSLLLKPRLLFQNLGIALRKQLSAPILSWRIKVHRITDIRREGPGIHARGIRHTDAEPDEFTRKRNSSESKSAEEPCPLPLPMQRAFL